MAERYAWEGTRPDYFWSKVVMRDFDECWLWLGSHSYAGYGYYNQRPAHRVSWMLTRHELPSDIHVCHTCDNKGCVNPNHLFAGTVSENLIDARDKGLLNIAKGQEAGSAKFTDEQAHAIRAEWKLGGVSMRALGRRFEVHHRTISDIVHGRSYQEDHEFRA